MITLTQAAVSFTALTTLCVGGWTAGDYLEVRPVILKEYKLTQADQTQVLKGLVDQQMQMNTSLFELQFQTLAMKRKMGGLDFMESQQFCQLAQTLNYTNVEGCE